MSIQRYLLEVHGAPDFMWSPWNDQQEATPDKVEVSVDTAGIHDSP